MQLDHTAEAKTDCPSPRRTRQGALPSLDDLSLLTPPPSTARPRSRIMGLHGTYHPLDCTCTPLTLRRQRENVWKTFRFTNRTARLSIIWGVLFPVAVYSVCQKQDVSAPSTPQETLRPRLTAAVLTPPPRLSPSFLRTRALSFARSPTRSSSGTSWARSATRLSLAGGHTRHHLLSEWCQQWRSRAAWGRCNGSGGRLSTESRGSADLDGRTQRSRLLSITATGAQAHRFRLSLSFTNG